MNPDSLAMYQQYDVVRSVTVMDVCMYNNTKYSPCLLNLESFGSISIWAGIYIAPSVTRHYRITVESNYLHGVNDQKRKKERKKEHETSDKTRISKQTL